ncbi:ubiquinol-cytochrome c reductase iron-sulfur subunit [Nocardioides jejuensis]|uniref:Cytochrome bc1 complex Rieske iron-sulfur subunit n=1 Tax=Nocardioides jejuensis TaxID=2502782 RepID=A0A4R1C1X1_9ACTN|nr:Rieske 2Fe-2S domain-containing protein [Nocardioides jejuensis]TCJ23736.1 ubiquinol-cytochrome C reductase [Nocardioides jejuensis]
MTDHTDSHAELAPAATAEPIADPGLAPHLPRPTDVDPKAERRAERQVAAMFVASMICAILFVIAYYSLDIKDSWDTFLGFGASNLALGLSLGFALLLIGIGVIQWSRKLMVDHEISELRHPAASDESDREKVLADLALGLEESGIGRRPLVRNTLLGALGFIGIPAVVALNDLGPDATPSNIKKTLEKTFWKAGKRVVNDVTGRWIKASDMEIGQLVNAEPEGLVDAFDPRATPEDQERIEAGSLHGAELQVAKTKSAVIVVRMEPKDMTTATQEWAHQGIAVYSKICTHVGCPIALWEQQTHHLLCPCHQSTFDLADKGRVVFGPAARPLPQLPIEVDSEGYLVAKSDFLEPVGPSYWERDSK